jgi:hypothetical protein
VHQNGARAKKGQRDWYEIMSMKWIDFDFMRKYDSKVNPENFIKSNYYWNMADSIGWQLKVGGARMTRYK